MGWTSILTQLWLGVHGTVPGCHDPSPCLGLFSKTLPRRSRNAQNTFLTFLDCSCLCWQTGLSENVVYPIVPNGFADHYPVSKNGYFIGGIPHFQTYPDVDSISTAGSCWRLFQLVANQKPEQSLALPATCVANLLTCLDLPWLALPCLVATKTCLVATKTCLVPSSVSTSHEFWIISDQFWIISDLDITSIYFHIKLDLPWSKPSFFSFRFQKMGRPFVSVPPTVCAGLDRVPCCGGKWPRAPSPPMADRNAVPRRAEPSWTASRALRFSGRSICRKIC